MAGSEDWLGLRIEHLIPETGIELKPDESYILEQGFERLHGVDFHKGCFVGQEVTVRMKHKTSLRKGLARLRVDGAVPPAGTAVENGGKDIGEILSSCGNRALAYLRFDRADGDLSAKGIPVEIDQGKPGAAWSE